MIESTNPTMSSSSDEYEFDEVDFEVADILLSLPILVAQSEARKMWGDKRKRSALSQPPPAPLLSQPPPPPQRGLKLVVGEQKWSPATPLSFPPSESEEKPEQSHKKASKKRKAKEELLEIIDSETKRRKMLTGELEKIKTHHAQLLAQNLSLKQQLTFCLQKRGLTQSESTTQSKNLGQDTLKAVQKQRQDQGPQQHVVVHHHQQALILNQTVYGGSLPMGEEIQCTLDHKSQLLLSLGSRMEVPHGQ